MKTVGIKCPFCGGAVGFGDRSVIIEKDAANIQTDG